MKIKVQVHANSSQEKVLEVSENRLEVWIKEKPVDGKANSELIKMMKRYFNKPARITSGFNSRNKIVEVEK